PPRLNGTGNAAR
ncbi:ccdB, partial [Vibrio cholerae HC-59B1]